jgi:hypothetical protein
MKLKQLFPVAFLLALAPISHAQDNKIIYPLRVLGPFPGSAWVVLGDITPIEKHNLIYSSHLEQGRIIFDRHTITIEPYFAAGLNLDSNGYVWNNEYALQGGVKLNKSFNHGVVSVGTAYAYENRYRAGGETARQGIGYIEDWFGWSLGEDRTDRFPGSTWATFGNIAPVEGNNLIGTGYVQQGYVAKRKGGWALVPFVEETYSADTMRFDWNNFSRTGAGTKVILAPGVEVGASYIHEQRFQSGLEAGGFSLFLKLWKGWDLRGYGN